MTSCRSPELWLLCMVHAVSAPAPQAWLLHASNRPGVRCPHQCYMQQVQAAQGLLWSISGQQLPHLPPPADTTTYQIPAGCKDSTPCLPATALVL